MGTVGRQDEHTYCGELQGLQDSRKMNFPIRWTDGTVAFAARLLSDNAFMGNGEVSIIYVYRKIGEGQRFCLRQHGSKWGGVRGYSDNSLLFH